MTSGRLDDAAPRHPRSAATAPHSDTTPPHPTEATAHHGTDATTDRRGFLTSLVGLFAAACGGARSPTAPREDRLRGAIPSAVDALLYVDVQRLRAAIGDETFRRLAGHERDPSLRALSTAIAARGRQLLIGFRGLPPDDLVLSVTGDFGEARHLVAEGLEPDSAHPGEYVRGDARGRTELAFVQLTDDRIVAATAALVVATSAAARGAAPPTQLDPPRDAPLGLALRLRRPMPGLGAPSRVTASIEAFPRGLEARVVAAYPSEGLAEGAREKLSALVVQLRHRKDAAALVARGLDDPTRAGAEVSARVRLPLSLFVDTSDDPPPPSAP